MINLLVALQAEARPIINHFGLNGRPPVAGFHRYGNPQINLVVTGVGPVAMAGGVMLLGLDPAATSAAWVNVGIAGHAHLPIGTPLIASKITDQHSGLRWYPPQVLTADLTTSELVTVAPPSLEYPAQGAVDMESSGFYPTACRFATGELVQCLKVVSDNRDNPSSLLNKAVIGELVGGLLAPLEQLMDRLQAPLAETSLAVADAADMQPFLDNWRLSQTQQRLLSRLLHDYRLLVGHLPTVSDYRHHRRGSALLAALEADLMTLRLNQSSTD